MHLKSLYLNGFKSFALPTTLQFTPGVTAIVGPNGSGKSNVADAVRWVLGEMSLKTLRGKKSEDVIFAGSRMRAGHSLAEVTLSFDNNDGGIPVDAAEVAITRRLFRNGESEYEINGTQVRLMDIHEVLTKAGLGERSYAVIGQGQVDAILRATPAERKEFFEEAAGVKQFQLKKEQALRKLETTRRNLIRVEDLIREIRPRLNSLKRQADRAAIREEVEKELRGESLRWFGAELAAIEEAAQKDLSAIEKVNAERAQLEDKIAHFEKSHLAAEEKALEEQRTLLQNRINQARQNISGFESERAEARRRQAGLQQQELPLDVAQFPAQIAEQEAQLAPLTRQAASLVPQIEQLREKVKKAEKESATLAAQIQKLRTSMTTPRRGRTLSQNEIAAQLSEVEKSFEQLLNQLEELERLEDLPALLKAAAAPKQHLRRLREQIVHPSALDSGTFARDLDRLLETRDDVVAGLANHREQLATHETEHRLLSKQIEALEKNIAQLKAQLKGAKKEGSAGAQKAALAELQKELLQIEQKIATEDELLRGLERELQESAAATEKIRAETRKNLADTKTLREQLAQIVDQQASLNVEKGKYDVRKEDLLAEAKSSLGEDASKTLARGGAETLTTEQRGTLRIKVDQLRKKLELAGGVDETVLAEYTETKERFDFLESQSGDLEKASDSLRSLIQELDHKIHERFAKSLDEINIEFDRAFKVLFNGGMSKLVPVRAARKKASDSDEEITDEQDAPEETDAQDDVTREVERLRDSSGIIGVDVKATPPGKKLQGIGMLSGGEKALTSIALLSAILATKPSPFVILDEVDAALDEANSRRFAKIVKSLASKTQFITITHNRETMRQASILYGVTMQKDGVSKLLSVKLDSVEKVAALSSQ
jgi:chromosome segregation protein